MGTSASAIPKLPRKRKVTAELSFGSSSTGDSSLICHRQAKLTDLVAHLMTTQKGKVYEHRVDLGATIGESCEDEPVHTIKPLLEDSEVGTSTVVDPRSRVGGDDKTVRIGKPEPKRLTERDVLDILRQMGQVLLKKGLSQKHGLVEVLSPLHGKVMLETHGMTTAFPDPHPGFIAVHEDYIFTDLFTTRTLTAKFKVAPRRTSTMKLLLFPVIDWFQQRLPERGSLR
ncbi:hypothetical protein HPB50_002470 [Hyalomma asiaticum]|uniref:Uncharacterized protein n=1 Tax=Hyalomma asiaticum TaxID=266040 RepID=A0ACB7RJ04_HYAAI|nr:hypothetical protein HPB50_002470 [Hyalomma asiaticum]